jgi:hypothetical protein
MRAFADIASTTEHVDLRARLLERTRRVTVGCAEHLPKDELTKLQRRFSALETIVASAAET